MTKRVIVQMQDSCHAVLKQYASFLGWTMSDVMYEAGRHRIHTHAEQNKGVKAILDMHGKAIDGRVYKPCFGPECFHCGAYEECKAGRYEGWAPHLHPNGAEKQEASSLG